MPQLNLRKDTKAKFLPSGWGGFMMLERQWRFSCGKISAQASLTDADYKSLLKRQEEMPVMVMDDDASRLRWWMFKGNCYRDAEGLPEAETKVLIQDLDNQRRRKVERALIRGSHRTVPRHGREPIPDEVKVLVWQRDGGRCIKCGSQEKLEFDHIIPLSRGGSNSFRNLQLLCENCNRTKSGNLV